MGIVFEAEDLRLRRRVALKVMRPSQTAHPSARERFVREARAAAALEHDHIVTIYEAGEDRGLSFLAMPLLQGESLEDRLRREDPLPTAEVRRIGRETAEALAAAHDAGLIHRDIKPGNLWLEKGNGRVKVLDFGLARTVIAGGQVTQTGAVIGTPGYMAPEQARGLPLDARADLFSLGCVLYQMATGRRPFPGAEPLAMLTSLALDTPALPHELNREVPPDLSRLIVRLLEKDPAKRPGSAREVADLLATVEVTPFPGSGRDDAPTGSVAHTPAARPGRRWFPLEVAVGVLALFLLIGGGYAVYQIAFQTPDGTLIVQIDDEKVEARFKNGRLQLLDDDGEVKYTLAPSERNKALPPGQYRIAVRGADGLTVDVDQFVLRKNGKRTVRVILDPKSVARAAKADPPKPAALAPPQRREKPFVLVRAGKPVRDFRTLAGVLNEVEAGDVVEIHSDGPYPVGVTKINDGHLTLRAAPGCRPVLVLETPLKVNGGSFMAEGLDIYQLRGHTETIDFEKARVELRNCRLWLDGGLRCIDGSGLRMTDCLVLALQGIALQGTANGDFDNCVLAAYAYAVNVLPTERVSVQLRRCTVAAGCAILLLGAPPVTVKAHGNLFHGLVVGGPQGRAWGKDDRWSGGNNLYAEHVFVHPDTKKWLSMDDWFKFVGNKEAGSRATTSQLRMESSRVIQLPWEKARPEVRQQIEEVRRRTGLADLGPDVDRIGPGAAYLKALAADGKPVAEKALRPEALAGGSFVLVRNGKEVAGHGSLQAAIDAARGGDVVEVRTDGPFKGCTCAGKERRLTIRSAPGYVPTLEGGLIVESDRVAVEGIRFVKGGITCPYKVTVPPQWRFTHTGCIARLVNCVFEPSEGSILVMFHGDQKGRPAEVVNCCVGNGIRFQILTDERVILRNCTGPGMQFKPAGDGAYGLELDRCFWWVEDSPFVDHVVRWLPSFTPATARSKLSVRSRLTLFQTPRDLVFASQPGPERLPWSGEKNVYRTWLFSVTLSIDSFAAWRKLHPEDVGSRQDVPQRFDPRQWKLLPGSPGFGMLGKDGDAGADVSKIGVTAPVLPPRSLADREKPFVLVRDGKPVREFKTAAGLLAEMKDGDAIEVHGNGPFELPLIRLDGTGLTLRAAPGYRPRFVPAGNVRPEHVTWIWVQRAPLRLEGCDFRLGISNVHMIRASGNCNIHRCRLSRCEGLNDWLLWLEGPENRVTDCVLLHGFSHNGIGLPAKGTLVFENNLYLCRAFAMFSTRGSDDLHLRLKGNTFIGAHSLLAVTETPRTPITVEASSNIISLGKHVIQAAEIKKTGVKEWLRWHGKDNLCTAPQGYLAIDFKPVLARLDDWKRCWGKDEEGCREAKGPYIPFDAFDLAKAPEEKLREVRKFVELSRPARMTGAGLDWDQVGPGEAYLRALAAAGRAVPKEQLRREALPGGAFALWRGGKLVRGFPGLAEAVDAAGDGDVIELRTDRRVDAVDRTGRKGKSLTLRAAPGYRPVLHGSLLLGRGDAWAFEGLHFRDPLNTGGEAKDRGQVTRLQNCSFDSRASIHDPMLLLPIRDPRSAVEVVNSLVPGLVLIEQSAGEQPLRLRNSLVQYLYFQGPDRGTCRLDLRRCIVWAPGLIGAAIDVNRAGTAAIHAEGCWFELYVLAWAVRPGALKWSGNRNVYRLGPERWLAASFEDPAPCYRLASWQRLWKSDADSEELDPLWADPFQWRLLPGTPGHRQGPDGKDLGADVSRVARTPWAEPHPDLETFTRLCELVAADSRMHPLSLSRAPREAADIFRAILACGFSPA
jgi:hypothetical protein